MNHTPGPWDIESDRGVPRVVRQHVDSDVAVALMPRWSLSHLGEMNANATLIAAAPNLLEVCELAEDMPEINMVNYDFDDVVALQAWAFRVVDAMREAKELATKGTE